MDALRGKDDVYILCTDLDTAKTLRVLEDKGLPIEEGRIIDCQKDFGGSKVEALLSVLERKGEQGGQVHYVEDQTATLQEMAGDLRLAQSVHLHFAEWGHSTSKNKAAVAAWPRVKNLTPEGLVLLLERQGAH